MGTGEDEAEGESELGKNNINGMPECSHLQSFAHERYCQNR
jgi:hypothetical protein